MQDGLGIRTRVEDRPGIETLVIAPELADAPGFEAAMRAAADRWAALKPAALVPVERIERCDGTLCVTTPLPPGVRLSDWLEAVAAGRAQMDDAQAIEVAQAVGQALAAVHRADPALAHGTVTPAHIAFTPEGRCVLTDGIYARAIESLQWNRGSLWRRFGVALPPSASAHRFDQRGDVTQLGAVVLAILLRRPLGSTEYPRGIDDLVLAATPDRFSGASALRTWLQQALQLHPRAVFASAVEASLSLDEAAAASGLRRTRRPGAFSSPVPPATMTRTGCRIAP